MALPSPPLLACGGGTCVPAHEGLPAAFEGFGLAFWLAKAGLP